MNKQNIIIQPIGKENEIDGFLKNSRGKWAEKDIYKEQWLQSENCIVLFAKDGDIFAKGTITKIEDSGHKTYPLRYYYNLEEVSEIDYAEIKHLANTSLPYFRTYELFNDDISNKIIEYLDSIDIKEIYLNEDEADIELQKTIQDIKSVFPEEKPQMPKNAREVNGYKVFPRNLSYAKGALEKANYLCEVDENHETFISKSLNKQYMEAHHLIPLRCQYDFNYSLDVIGNMVSLCPNCHREIHQGKANRILEILFIKYQNKLKKYGLEVSLEDLKAIY